LINENVTQVGISKNANVFVGLNSEKQASNLRKLVNFIRKKQDCLQVFYSFHETKLFGVN
jgi:hypothetical protein